MAKIDYKQEHKYINKIASVALNTVKSLNPGM